MASERLRQHGLCLLFPCGRAKVLQQEPCLSPQQWGRAGLFLGTADVLSTQAAKAGGNGVLVEPPNGSAGFTVFTALPHLNSWWRVVLLSLWFLRGP